MHWARIASLGAVLVVVTACASATDRFEQGLELEAQGDHYAAALRYIDALAKDSSLDGVRIRLTEAGTRAVSEGLSRAERRGVGRTPPIEGGRTVLGLDRLIDEAAAVGVRLGVPVGFSQRRTQVLDNAAAALQRVADDAERDGAWDEAVDALRELRLDMATTEERARAAGESEARVFLAWADDNLESDRYRSAFNHAQEAMELSTNSEVQSEALDAQDRAVEFGTMFVAVLPTWLSAGARADEPIAPELTLALDDALELDHWSQPPLFVAVVPSPETRRALRTAGRTSAGLDNSELRLLLSDLDADLAAIIEVTAIEAEKSSVRSEVVEIPLEGGGVASTRLERGRVRYTVHADIEVIGDGGQRLGRTSVSADASDDYERGIYDGDVRTLLLSSRQREHFDSGVQAALRRQIQEEAAAELAQDVARWVFATSESAVR